MILRAALLLLLALCALPSAALHAAGPDPAHEPIVGDETLRGLFLDRTFYGRYEDGSRWIEYYAPDGRSAYWDGCTHDGRWWIVDGRACFRYRGDAQHADYCWQVSRTAAGIEFSIPADAPTGPARAYTTAIRPGNSENLPLGVDDCVSAEVGPRLDAVRRR